VEAAVEAAAVAAELAEPDFVEHRHDGVPASVVLCDRVPGAGHVLVFVTVQGILSEILKYILSHIN